MMYELLHAGFDTLDVAIAGSLPPETLEVLEAVREKAQETQEDELVAIGPACSAARFLDTA